MASESPDLAKEALRSEYDEARGTKFKFKSKSKRSRRDEYGEEDEESRRRGKRRRSKAHDDKTEASSSHRYKSRKRDYHSPLGDVPAAYDDTYAKDPRSSTYLDPNLAFRESLFDAMADDEGAAFWEGVYGQPIHVYPQPDKEGRAGELEQMTDEEYAEYVRGRMWEKTHQHVLEERAKREERRKRRKMEEDAWDREEAEREEQRQQERDERRRFESKIEASLRRGEERRAQKRWVDAWQIYIKGWERFAGVVAVKSKEEGSLQGKAARGIIPWPVETGKWRDVEKESVEEFFTKAVPASEEKMAVLKVERIRWHPDKMQQRFGATKLDEEAVRKVTAVFQVVDRLWGELRDGR